MSGIETAAARARAPQAPLAWHVNVTIGSEAIQCFRDTTITYGEAANGGRWRPAWFLPRRKEALNGWSKLTIVARG